MLRTVISKLVVCVDNAKTRMQHTVDHYIREQLQHHTHNSSSKCSPPEASTPAAKGQSPVFCPQQGSVTLVMCDGEGDGGVGGGVSSSSFRYSSLTTSIR